MPVMILRHDTHPDEVLKYAFDIIRIQLVVVGSILHDLSELEHLFKGLDDLLLHHNVHLRFTFFYLLKAVDLLLLLKGRKGINGNVKLECLIKEVKLFSLLNT